jgi:hypothetical protein
VDASRLAARDKAHPAPNDPPPRRFPMNVERAVALAILVVLLLVILRAAHLI